MVSRARTVISCVPEATPAAVGLAPRPREAPGGDGKNAIDEAHTADGAKDGASAAVVRAVPSGNGETDAVYMTDALDDARHGPRAVALLRPLNLLAFFKITGSSGPVAGRPPTVALVTNAVVPAVVAVATASQGVVARDEVDGLMRIERLPSRPAAHQPVPGWFVDPGPRRAVPLRQAPAAASTDGAA